MTTTATRIVENLREAVIAAMAGLKARGMTMADARRYHAAVTTCRVSRKRTNYDRYGAAYAAVASVRQWVAVKKEYDDCRDATTKICGVWWRRSTPRRPTTAAGKRWTRCRTRRRPGRGTNCLFERTIRPKETDHELRTVPQPRVSESLDDDQLRCDEPPTGELLAAMDQTGLDKWERFVNRLQREADANLTRMAFGGEYL